MTQTEAKQRAIEFMSSLGGIRPWSFSKIIFLPAEFHVESAKWSVVFEFADEHPDWFDGAVSIVIVDDLTGVATLFETDR